MERMTGRTLLDAATDAAKIERLLSHAAEGARALARMFEHGSPKNHYYTGRAHAFDDAIVLLRENG